MKRILAIFISTIFIFQCGLCLAGTPKGLEKKGKTPKGFSQGEKTGWDGEYPKGWEKLSKEQKEEWLLKHGLEKDEDGNVKEMRQKKEKKSKKKSKKK